MVDLSSFGRWVRAIVAVATLGALVAGTAVPATAADLARDFSVSVSPGRVVPGSPVVVRLTLPSGTAAADGRVLFDTRAADFIGIAPLGGGTALYPEAIAGGVAFGAYDLHTQTGGTILRFILEPRLAGSLQVRVLVDDTANAAGERLSLMRAARVSSVAVVGGSSAVHVAPISGARAVPLRPAGSVTGAISAGRLDQSDLAAVGGAWNQAAVAADACSGTLPGDANGDGCVDIVDVQATLAAVAAHGGGRMEAANPNSGRPHVTPAGTPVYAHTWTVDSNADGADVKVGDGTCADSTGKCTLRAAIQEANALAGDDLIAFDIPGTAPAPIHISSRLPMITSTHGTVTIDGYSQPGSRVSTATIGSNAVPGIELHGTSTLLTDDQIGLYITSNGNTVRGLEIDDVYRGIMIDGAGAYGNVIVGNWIGFTGAGTNPASNGEHGILLNTGANHNIIGTPALADRNVIGNWAKAIDSYGPGTDFNTIQDNLFCIGPTGFTKATCGTAIDHDFGPKNELLGGAGTNMRNVIGPTNYQGIEYSHGWNPNNKKDTTWQINNNQAIGNWVGFRGDGSYQASFRSGLLFAPTDNGEGINVYDGSNKNVIQGNFIASVYVGIQVMSPNAKGNIIRGNVIGTSPTGQAAPLKSWGIKLRWGTTLDVIDANRISNAASGGIGLVNVDNEGGAQPVPYNIRISGNLVTRTNGPAIYLARTQSNHKKGANGLLAAPRITSARAGVVRGTGTPGYTVEVFRATRGAGKFGLPDVYYGTTTVAASGKWRLTLSVTSLPHRVTALQIATDQNTSALAANVKVRP